MTRSAVDHVTQAVSRPIAARDPMGVLVAQTGFGLALTELATGPVRVWLDVIPKLHEYCLALVDDDPPAPSFAAPAPPAEAMPAQVRPSRQAPASRERLRGGHGGNSRYRPSWHRRYGRHV